MIRMMFMVTGLAFMPSLSMACGLDWTLPQAHFDGVEEHGYVAYWEKIGEIDMGNGLVIPVNINFNSHREANSPYLGKGWLVALLESHVEPIDENSMHVIMPDGWTFIFFRNGNTETWRGNSSWVGETKNTIFTITAPCGWRIKFDQGKIQEIDSNTSRTFTYRYNAGVATEVDENGKAFVRVESNTTTGMTTGLVIGDQKITVTQAQRPRVMLVSKQNLITGFDQSLSQLQWPDQKIESFTFGTDKTLSPTLAITHLDQTRRNFSWDSTTRMIKTDGEWTYKLAVDLKGNEIPLSRTNVEGQNEYFYHDPANGTTTIVGLNGFKKIIRNFGYAGKVSGKLRSIDEWNQGKLKKSVHYSYDETGHVIRIEDGDFDIYYTKDHMMEKITKNGMPYMQTTFDENGGIKSVHYF